MRTLSLLLSGCIMDTQLWANGGSPQDPTLPRVDLDGDGFTTDEGDCNDFEPAEAPDQWETCDGFDNDCSGIADVARSGLDVCDARGVFVQQLRADVLIVVDNTPSMEEHWSKAADGACAMVEHLMGQGFDTQIGVLMTHADELGDLVEVSEKPGHPWIIGNSPGFAPADACSWLGFAIRRAQPYPSADEAVEQEARGGRAAIAAALPGHGNEHNEGFFRPDADLAILLLSDREDRSLPANAEFLTLLAKQKLGTGAGLSIHAITREGEEDCEGRPTEIEADSVLELVDTTEGMSESYCLSDYTGFLSGVGQDIATKSLGDTFRFELDAPARLGTIEVTIEAGGDRYPWAGAIALEDPWTLVFTSTRPPAGSTIIVDYKRAWERAR